MTVASTSEQIAYVRLITAKARLRLESLGMKARGPSTRSIMAPELGLKARDSYEKFLSVIETKIEENLRRMSGEDVEVVARDMLDDEHRAKFDLPWLVQHSTGYVVQFGNEKDACTYQREWRVSVGRDPMTGEPA